MEGQKSKYDGAKAVSRYIKTEKGNVYIESRLTLKSIQDLIFSPGFTSHAHYKSIYTRKETLVNSIKNGGSVAVAFLNNKTIVGYAVLDYPNTKERWAKFNGKIIMELKAIEVLREFRNCRIAQHLLIHLFSDPELERKIIYLTAYSWTWDLGYLGLSVSAYKRMLTSLYADFGFKEYQTNEPNICLKPENFFMARVGKSVPQKIQEGFKWLRFGLKL